MVSLTDGLFVSGKKADLDTWTHVHVNYIGPNNGQGIRLYYNGAEVTSSASKGISGSPYSPADGRMVVGKSYVDTNLDHFASLAVDELLFFNSQLTDEQITALYEMY